LETNTYDARKALISFVVEQTLLDVGKLAMEEVGSRLYEKHQCYFADCLENPQYLLEVLQEIFGSSYKSVTDKIEIKLDELKDQQSIAEFLTVISK